MTPPAAELAIAKASFSAVLFRPDPTSCSRDEIEQFHGLLGETISRCSPTNVQKCKQWALHHLVQSPARAGSLGKYLVALANTYTPETLAHSSRPSAKRRRLHILYILGDIFYHTKRRLGDDTFIKSTEPHLPALVKSAASFSNCSKHIQKLESLINIWEDNGYFSSDFTKDLRRAVEDGPAHSGSADQSGPEGAQNSTSSSKAKEAPFVMPSVHGDVSTPWYDLPAGNWLPAIEPNSTRPMNPSMIRPLQLASGPPDKTLVDAVKKLLVDVDKIYAKDLRLDGDTLLDIGQTGEVIERDEINGDIISGDTYYGWSRAFCQRMKARRKNGGNDESRGRASSRDHSRSLSRSPSRDRSSSRGSFRPAFKRRRLSSTSRSRSGSARQERYRDVSRSPSRSRSRSHRRSYSRPGFQRSSRSYSRSRSPPSRRNFGKDFDGGPRSRSPHYSPPPSMPPTYGNNNHFNQPPPPPSNMPPIAPPQPNYGGWNVPPPPPPPPGGYQGQWPPPPPAGGPPQQQNWFPPNSNHWTGGWGGVPPPPPPPPPVSQQQGGYQYSRGGGGGYRGGRGGYNNRGRGW